MAKNWQDDLESLLAQYMQCSVTERYDLIRQTKWGQANYLILNLQGAILNVKGSFVEIFSVQGGYEEFVRQIKALPKPSWFREN